MADVLLFPGSRAKSSHRPWNVTVKYRSGDAAQFKGVTVPSIDHVTVRLHGLLIPFDDIMEIRINPVVSQ